MAIDEELLDFVRNALARGLSRPQINEALLKAGWETSQVKSALNAFAEIEFPIPVPRPKLYLSARETFMDLVLFTTMYISAFSFGDIIFQFINLAYPDMAAYGRSADGVHEAIRWAVAYLIIAFPIFLYISRLVNRSVRLDPGKRTSKIRKWLTYMTLFITAGFIIGDLTTLVYNFLSGELTVRFILKVLTVGIISSAIFGYYLWGLKREEVEIQS